MENLWISTGKIPLTISADLTRSGTYLLEGGFAIFEAQWVRVGSHGFSLLGQVGYTCGNLAFRFGRVWEPLPSRGLGGEMFPRFWAKILAFLLLSHLFQVWSWPKVETGASPREASPPKGEYMTLGQALILGVVEGITEFLPISSTGHLLLAQRVMGVAPRGSEGASSPSKKEASDAYAISIQGGAIIAVLLLYRRRIWSMALGALGRDPAGFQLAIRLCAAFLPAALLGLLLERTIKHYLFGPWPIVVAWFGGGLGIFLVSRIVPKRGRPMEELQLKAALLIGLFQCLAMWPGVSRSLATIVGGLLCGLSMKAAVEFSFLLGLVTLAAASLFDLVKHWSVMVEFLELAPMAMGFLSSMISAVVAVRWMVGYLERHGLEIFGYYRIGIASATAFLLLAGIL
jgi:undecaprenyl-diphosphatase